MDAFSSLFLSFPFLPLLLAIVILAYWIHAFFIIYHLVRFGIGVKPKIFALIFFLGSMTLFMAAIFYFNHIDFSLLSLKFDLFKMPSFDFQTPTL